MKKYMLFVLLASIGAISYAATQYNWGTSTGGSWITPDETATTPNAFVVVTSTVPPVMVATGQPWLQSRTITQINAATATAVGQLVFCSNCITSPICISTGTAGSIDGGFNQFVVVASTPGSAVYRKCI